MFWHKRYLLLAKNIINIVYKLILRKKKKKNLIDDLRVGETTRWI